MFHASYACLLEQSNYLLLGQNLFYFWGQLTWGAAYWRTPGWHIAGLFPHNVHGSTPCARVTKHTHMPTPCSRTCSTAFMQLKVLLGRAATQTCCCVGWFWMEKKNQLLQGTLLWAKGLTCGCNQGSIGQGSWVGALGWEISVGSVFGRLYGVCWPGKCLPAELD